MLRRVATLAAALMLGACGPDDPPEPVPDWSWQGEHVTIHAYGYAPEHACGGTFEQTDLHVAQIAEWHGVDPAEFDIPIRWVANPRFADEGWCPSYAAGCVVDGKLRVPRLPFGHELSHAVDYAIGLRGYAPVLEEGFAAIHSDPVVGGPPTPEEPIDREAELPGDIRDALVEPPEPPDQWFSVLTAGHFVTYLIETYGLDTVQQLRARAGPDTGQAQWEALFQELLGEGFEEVLAGYEAFPLCSWNQYRSKLWECSGEADVTATPDMSPATFTVDLTCDNPDAIGNSPGYVRASRRLLVPDPGADEWGNHERLYRIDVRQAGSAKLEFGVMMVEECAVSCSEGARVWAIPGGLDEVEEVGWNLLVYALRPGTYALVFSGAGSYEITIDPA